MYILKRFNLKPEFKDSHPLTIHLDDFYIDDKFKRIWNEIIFN